MAGGRAIAGKSRGKPPVPRSQASTPVVGWSTPWTPVDKTNKVTPPSPAPTVPHGKHRRRSSLELETERLTQEKEQRRTSLDLLEARSMNRTLSLQLSQDQHEVEELKAELERVRLANEMLTEELEKARESLEHLQYDELQRSEALTKHAVLLSSEREIRRHAEEELERCQAAIMKNKIAIRRGPTSWLAETDSGDTTPDSGDEPIVTEESMPHHLPLLPELVDDVRRSLTGTVSQWIQDMQAACSPGIREALVLPWLLQKLFFLCTELIDERREELVSIFVGGGPGGAGSGGEEDDSEQAGSRMEMDSRTAAFMRRHLRRHHLTLFPLTGGNLKVATNKIMMSLAHSMIDSKEWDPNSNDPTAVHRVLAASGLEKIVEEYLHIMVGCCLQYPAVAFTDDLGQVERYDPDLHSESLDGENATAGEWCMIVFPALSVGGSCGGKEVEGQWTGVGPEILGKRFVLMSRNKSC